MMSHMGPGGRAFYIHADDMSSNIIQVDFNSFLVIMLKVLEIGASPVERASFQNYPI